MKKVIYNLIFLYSFFNVSTTLVAQNVGVGTNSPDPSAKLHIEDSNRGILIPNVNLSSLNSPNPVTSPADGLLVYNGNPSFSGGKGFYFWNTSNYYFRDMRRLPWEENFETGVAFVKDTFMKQS